METAITCPLHTPIKSKNIKLLKTRQSRNISRFGNSYIRPSQLRSVQQQEEELINPMNWFTNQQQQQQPWFTVVPVGVYRPEEVRVKLNPLCHLLVIKTVPSMQRTPLFRGVNKPIHQIITLPKTINFDKVRVQLNQRGELLVIAPFKSTQGRQSFGQMQQGQNTFVPPYFQEKNLQWTEVPITTYQLISRSVLNKPRQQQSSFYPYQGESDSTTTTTSTDSDASTTTTDTETESDTESESESESGSGSGSGSENEYEGGISGRIPMNQVLVQKYVSLLKKIFFPNIVTVKFVPLETTKSQQSQQMQFVIEVKFVDFRSEEIQVRLQKNMLIVEAKRTCLLQKPLSINAVKYARREFMIPKWLDVNHLVYRVLPNGVLCFKVPLLTKSLGSASYPQVGLPQICGHLCLCHTKPFQGQQNKWQVPKRHL
jgi:virulence-associated protein VagC